MTEEEIPCNIEIDEVQVEFECPECGEKVYADISFMSDIIECKNCLTQFELLEPDFECINHGAVVVV